jgi:hypothetical protein
MNSFPLADSPRLALIFVYRSPSSSVNRVTSGNDFAARALKNERFIFTHAQEFCNLWQWSGSIDQHREVEVSNPRCRP